MNLSFISIPMRSSSSKKTHLKIDRENSCAFYLTIMSIVNVGQLLTGLFSRIMDSLLIGLKYRYFFSMGIIDQYVEDADNEIILNQLIVTLIFSYRRVPFIRRQSN